MLNEETKANGQDKKGDQEQDQETKFSDYGQDTNTGYQTHDLDTKPQDHDWESGPNYRKRSQSGCKTDPRRLTMDAYATCDTGMDMCWSIYGLGWV